MVENIFEKWDNIQILNFHFSAKRLLQVADDINQISVEQPDYLGRLGTYALKNKLGKISTCFAPLPEKEEDN